MPEIAALAGVRRPVVTTWRRRHADFPEAVGGSPGRPLFDAGDVVDWLVATGRSERRAIEPELRLYAIEDLSAHLPPDTLPAVATALICLRHIDDELLVEPDEISQTTAERLRQRAAAADPGDEFLRTEVQVLGEGARPLVAAIDELIEAAWGCREAFERLLAARDRLQFPALAMDAVVAPLAQLAAELSGVQECAEEHEEVSIAGGAAGAGDLLIALIRALPEPAAPVVFAAEHDRGLARMLRRRLIVHGLPPSEFIVHEAESLPYDTPPVHAVATRLPYRPVEANANESALDTVGWIADGMATGGTAVIVGPAAALVGPLPAHGSADRLRRNILATGVVEAVINLPGGLVPFRPGHRTALWVLRRERPSQWQGRTLLADVSDQPLDAQLADELAEEVVTWRRDAYDPGWRARRLTVQVALDELLVPGRALISRPPPSLRDVAERAPAQVAYVLQVEGLLSKLDEEAYAGWGPGRSGLAVRNGPLPPIVTVRELLRRGWLELLPGTRLQEAELRADGHYLVLGAAELCGETRRGDRRIDRLVHAQNRRGYLTEQGDVVVTTTPSIGVWVDSTGGSVVRFPARVVRIMPSAGPHLTPGMLGAMIAAYGRSKASRPPGAVRSAQRLVDYEIRLLPRDEIGRLDALLAEFDGRHQQAQASVDLLSELRRVVVGGIAEGTLTLASTS